MKKAKILAAVAALGLPICLWVLRSSPGQAWAETVELVTYFPSAGSGADPDPNFNSLAVGPDYSTQTPGAGVAIIQNRVGIGTSAPAYNLHVNGTSNFTDTMNFGNGAEGVISWGSMGGNPGFGIRSAEGKSLSLGSGGVWDRLVINKDTGNVGIGTSAPAAQLDVQASTVNARFYSTGANSSLNFQLRNPAQIWQFYLDGADSNKLKIRDGSGNAFFTLTSTGQIGIGSTLALSNPSETLPASTNIDFSHSTGIGSTATSRLEVVKAASASHHMVFSLANNGVIQENVRILNSGNVGIGTSGPERLLEVSGLGPVGSWWQPLRLTNTSTGGSWRNSSGVEMRVTSSTGTVSLGGVRLEQYTFGNKGCNLFLAPASIIGSAFDAVMIGTNGRVQIGGISAGQLPPDYQLQVNGSLYINSTQTEKNGSTGWTAASSDARLKKNIMPIEGALDKMLRLKGVAYQWKEPEKHSNETGTYMGMLGQDVEKVFPSWVGRNAEGYRNLTIQGFEALTVESMRELESENGRLRQELKEQKARLEKLEAELARR